MYVGKHAWCMYVFMYVCMEADMHKSIHVSLCACIIYVCMHIHMYGGKNQYVSMNVDRHAQVCICLYVSNDVYRETCMIMYTHHHI